MLFPKPPYLSNILLHQTVRLPVIFKIVSGTETQPVSQVLSHWSQLFLSHCPRVYCYYLTQSKVCYVLQDLELRKGMLVGSMVVMYGVII